MRPLAVTTASFMPVASMLAFRREAYGLVSVKCSGSVEVRPRSYSVQGPSNSVRSRSSEPIRK